MSDDFDVYHANHEEAQEIIDWALSAAGMITLMATEHPSTTIEQAMAKLDRFEGAIRIMVSNMPPVLSHAGNVIAGDAIEAAEQEEKEVEELRKELDNPDWDTL